jgi:hypothetical protein
MTEDAGPLTFTAFVLSLATTAAVHFGDYEDPATRERQPPNLEGAAQMIDILTLLETKTRGNLSDEESALLGRLLYEMRMRYVEVRDKAASRIILP